MAYATVENVQARMSRTLSESERTICTTLLDDVGVMIDRYASEAGSEVKRIVSCRAVIRSLGDGTDVGVPLGATQGSMSALGYSQSWTIGGGGGAGEIYLSKAEKQMLGVGNRIGSHSPLEDLNEG